MGVRRRGSRPQHYLLPAMCLQQVALPLWCSVPHEGNNYLPKSSGSMLPNHHFIHLSWVRIISFLGVCAFREFFILIKGIVERAGAIALANTKICFNVEKNL